MLIKGGLRPPLEGRPPPSCAYGLDGRTDRQTWGEFGLVIKTIHTINTVHECPGHVGPHHPSVDTPGSLIHVGQSIGHVLIYLIVLATQVSLLTTFYLPGCSGKVWESLEHADPLDLRLVPCHLDNSLFGLLKHKFN